VNQQCIVRQFKRDPSNADYVGYSGRHFHQRIEEQKGAAIGLHRPKEQHEKETIDTTKNFSIPKS